MHMFQYPIGSRSVFKVFNESIDHFADTLHTRTYCIWVFTGIGVGGGGGGVLCPPPPPFFGSRNSGKIGEEFGQNAGRIRQRKNRANSLKKKGKLVVFLSQ